MFYTLMTIAIALSILLVVLIARELNQFINHDPDRFDDPLDW